MSRPDGTRAKTPADPLPTDLHTMLVRLRKDMEATLGAQLAEVEAALRERLTERDARIAAADALIARLQDERATLEADNRRHLDTLAKMRALAMGDRAG